MEYAGGADTVAGALAERGCEPGPDGLYECDIRGDDGRTYVAVISLSDQLRSRPARKRPRAKSARTST